MRVLEAGTRRNYGQWWTGVWRCYECGRTIELVASDPEPKAQPHRDAGLTRYVEFRDACPTCGFVTRHGRMSYPETPDEAD